MGKKCDYDVAIAGGGVAGLSAAILLSRAGYKTVLIEKHQYPYHKVCGEYISLESLQFLKLIDFNPGNLPVIDKLKLSAGNSVLTTNLPLGGIGVSRYFLDEKLMCIAKSCGTEILENTNVFSIDFSDDQFIFKTNSGEFTAKVALGAFGKRSNLKRKNNLQKPANNYIAVKYHVQADLPEDQIELHLFKEGYCGISKVEGINRYCMCYMTTANNLNKCNNNIERLEKEVLSKNPFLKSYLNEYEKIAGPIVISQIQLGVNEIIYNNMMMIGDASGTIAPLCGNGMSMALHSSYIAAHFIDQYLKELISYPDALNKYRIYWKENFYKRIYVGNYLQKMFLNLNAASFAIGLLKHLPSLHTPLINLTHGKDFVRNYQAGVPVR